MRINLQLNDEYVRNTDLHTLKESIKNTLRDNISPNIIAGYDGNNVPEISVNIDDDIVGIVHQIDFVLKAKALSIDAEKEACLCFGNEQDMLHSQYGIYYFYCKPELKCYPGSIVKLNNISYGNDDTGICVVKNPIIKKSFKPKKSVKAVIDNEELPYEIPKNAQLLFSLMYNLVLSNELQLSDIDLFINKVLRKE